MTTLHITEHITEHILCHRPTVITQVDEWDTPSVRWSGFCTRPRWHRGDCRDRNHHCDKDPNRGLNIFVSLIVLGSFVLGFFVATNFVNYANAAEPYGGCDEAWQAPNSQGAHQCRALGWHISRRIIVGPHRWVRFNTLPVCKAEDGPAPCYWDAARLGDHKGRSFYLTARRHYDPKVHYVRGFSRGTR